MMKEADSGNILIQMTREVNPKDCLVPSSNGSKAARSEAQILTMLCDGLTTRQLLRRASVILRDAKLSNIRERMPTHDREISFSV